MGFWFVDTAGIGSVIAVGVGLSVFVAYVALVRWIQTAPKDEPDGAEHPDHGPVGR